MVFFKIVCLYKKNSFTIISANRHCALSLSIDVKLDIRSNVYMYN